MSLWNLPLPLADVPPPPPELPLIDVTVPHPVVILIAGLCLAVAVMMLGTRVLKQRAGLSWPKFVAIGIVALTLLAAVWSQNQYRNHRKSRSNWRANGPIGPPPSRIPITAEEDGLSEQEP